jgi:hypothetical protein
MIFRKKIFFFAFFINWLIFFSFQAIAEPNKPIHCNYAPTSEDTGLKNVISETSNVLRNFNMNSKSILTRGISTLKININNDKCYLSENNFVACVQGIRSGLLVISDKPMSLIINNEQNESEIIKKSGPLSIVKTTIPVENLIIYYSLPADQQNKSIDHKKDRESLSQIFTSIQNGKNEKVDFEALLQMLHFNSTGTDKDKIQEDFLVNITAQAYTESYLVNEKIKSTPQSTDTKNQNEISLFVGTNFNKYVHCGLGCWQQDPLPNQWQDTNVGKGSIGISVGKISVEYHDYGNVNVTGTFVDDAHWDNKGAVINDATTINYTAIVKQKVQGISVMYSPNEHTIESEKFGKWAITTPAGILIYDNVATFQAFDRDTHQYLWPNLPNSTIYEHTNGVAWIAGIQAEKQAGLGKLGFRLTAVGGLGARKEDAPGGGVGMLTPGIYDFGIYYKVPIN